MELRHEAIGVDLLHHRLVEQAAERTVQQHLHAAQARRLADRTGQRIAVQPRHLDVRHHQLDRLGRLARGQFQQSLQRLAPVPGHHAIGAQLLEQIDQAPPRDARIVHHHHPARRQRATAGLTLHARRQLGRRRVDAGQHVLHVDHRQQRTVDPRHRVHARTETQRAGRRRHGVARAMHHPLQIGHQEALHRTIELGDHQMRRLHLAQRRVTQRGSQVDHRDGLPAIVATASDQFVHAVQALHRRATQHLAHLEYIDAEQLLVTQPEQQHRHPVVPGQPRVLLHLLQQCAGHAASSTSVAASATVCCTIGRARPAFRTRRQRRHSRQGRGRIGTSNHRAWPPNLPDGLRRPKCDSCLRRNDGKDDRNDDGEAPMATRNLAPHPLARGLLAQASTPVADAAATPPFPSRCLP
ncbi:hypothetical protein RLIN73S_07338 [Rhodanobacter lindaniclasticus]